MEEIFRNQYQKFYYDHRRSFFINVWHPDSQWLAEDEYKVEQVTLWDWIRKIKPRVITSDNTNFLYAIDPELQDWVAAQIDALIDEVRLERIAIILSRDFLALLTIRQTIEEGRFKDITRFFEKSEEAEDWLFPASQAA